MTEESTAPEQQDRITESSAIEGQVVMPFYLICDVSSSMTQDMTDLNNGVRDLIGQILDDPIVDDLVMLSLITFNHTARTVVPLTSPSEITPPILSASGGTTYSAAFREYQRAFDTDRQRLRAQGRKVYRPCVFFLTDGAPGDSDYLKVFNELLGYNQETKQGNKSYPYFVPIGFRDAPRHVVQTLAFPNFGTTRAPWFLIREQKISVALQAVREMIANTVVSSGQTAATGAPQIVAPKAPAGVDAQFAEGNFV